MMVGAPDPAAPSVAAGPPAACLEAVLGASPAPAFVLGPSGALLWGNPAFHRLATETPGLPASLARLVDEGASPGVGGAVDLVLELATGQGAPSLVDVQASLVEADGARTWCGTAHPRTRASRPDLDQRFLVALAERLRARRPSADIIAEVRRSLGEFLGADRIAYAEFDEAGDHMVVHADWTDGALVQAEGRHPAALLGDALQDYRAGVTRASHDLTAADQRNAVLDALNIAASVTVPLLRDGRLSAVLSVQQGRPRRWTPAEVALVEQVAERTWEALERSRAELRLRESEAQFRSLAENLPNLCWIGGPDGAIVWANGRFREFTGWSDAPSRTLEEAIAVAPEDRGAAGDAWRHARSTGTSLALRLHAEGATGRARAFWCQAEPVRDERGRVVRWCGILTDLTQQEAREGGARFLADLGEAMRLQADPQRLLSEACQLVGGRLDVGRVTLSEYREAERALHVVADWCEPPLAGLVGRRHVYGPRSLGPDVMRMGRTLACPDVAGLPASSDAFEAASRLMEARASISAPLIRSGALIAEFSVHQQQPRSWTAEEVHLVSEVGERLWASLERARAEEARRATEGLLTSILDHAPVGVYVKDADGRYVLVNPEMARLLGRPREELIGRTAGEVVDAEYAAEIAAQERLVMETGRAQVTEGRRRVGRTGSYDWSLITRFPVTTGEGAPRQVAGINVNLSAQKAAEAELERSREQLYQSEKLSALGSLLAGVSHELNNPLSIVVAQATMMERQGEGGPLAERARHIRAAAERCARIVQTFLAMARQRAPERRRVDLNGVVDAALELTAYGLRTSGVKVVRERAQDLPAISADADQLHQVVVNLVINAQHALAEQAGERRLVVRTAPAAEGGFVVLEIADNGPGVPEELRRRVFEPFFTTKPQDVGTGVGLSFSLGLVEAHGGRLELGDTPGGGATLRVVLPISAAAEPAAAPAPAAAGSAGPTRTALVVDDEPQIARALAEFLELEGYACETVFGGVEARARLAAGGEFDLILSDLRMPDVDGPALYAWIKAERPELAGRVAFSTGDTLGSTAVRFLAREGRPFMEKPFTPETLRTLLDDVETAGA